MFSSIGKFSKSISIKILVGIIILPFVFWGMGDIFRGGNQNILATIDSDKISSKEFFNYLNRLNLTEKEQKDLTKTNLMERILSEYIGKIIIDLEIEDFGIILTDSSLKDYIINDKTFYKNKKFSRGEYEKFLLKSGLSAPSFEKNISDQEKKRQLLSYLAQGLYVSDFLIQSSFSKENQIKNIKYINLNNYYDKRTITKEEINKTYIENKNLFQQTYKSINFIELKPDKLVGDKDYSENYFKKIDKIENDILDGVTLELVANNNNLTVIKTDEVNNQKNNILGINETSIDDDLFNEFFKIKNLNSPELINFKNKYYIAQISSQNKIAGKINDRPVNDAIIKQIKIKNIIENNIKISKEISKGDFKESNMGEYAKKNNIDVKKTQLKNLKNNEIFSEDIIKEIFKMNDKQINLITDSTLSKNFIVYIDNTKKISIEKNSKDYEKYKSQAKLNLARDIYNVYDKSVNNKYKIDVNNKALERIKNSF